MSATMAVIDGVAVNFRRVEAIVEGWHNSTVIHLKSGTSLCVDEPFENVMKAWEEWVKHE